MHRGWEALNPIANLSIYPHTRVRAHTHARAHTHTHTQYIGISITDQLYNSRTLPQNIVAEFLFSVNPSNQSPWDIKICQNMAATTDYTSFLTYPSLADLLIMWQYFSFVTSVISAVKQTWETPVSPFQAQLVIKHFSGFSHCVAHIKFTWFTIWFTFLQFLSQNHAHQSVLGLCNNGKILILYQ